MHYSSYLTISQDTCIAKYLSPNMSYVMRKPALRMCNQVRLRPDCAAKEANKSLGISNIATIQTEKNKDADQHVQI